MPRGRTDCATPVKPMSEILAAPILRANHLFSRILRSEKVSQSVWKPKSKSLASQLRIPSSPSSSSSETNCWEACLNNSNWRRNHGKTMFKHQNRESRESPDDRRHSVVRRRRLYGTGDTVPCRGESRQSNPAFGAARPGIFVYRQAPVTSSCLTQGRKESWPRESFRDRS